MTFENHRNSCAIAGVASWRAVSALTLALMLATHTHTHTHSHAYIHKYVCIYMYTLSLYVGTDAQKDSLHCLHIVNVLGQLLLSLVRV